MGCVQSEIENDTMSLDFLVILKKKDFSKTLECFNKKNKILRSLSKLPGNVNIGRFGETKYVVKGLKMPYVLYTKLPKEDIYVTSDSWDVEYFNSQILELIQIFTSLGATEIKFYSNSEHSSEKHKGITTALKVPNVPLKLSAELFNSEEHEIENSLCGLVKIKSSKIINYSGVDEFIKINKLFYTKFYPEWKGIILYKLSNHITDLDFEYTFHRGLYCNSSLGLDLEKVGISCKITSAINNSTTVSFKVKF